VLGLFIAEDLFAEVQSFAPHSLVLHRELENVTGIFNQLAVW
jgi:hypothetical protein